MQTYNPKQYKEIFDKLPKEIQDLVTLSERSEIIWKIGKVRGLQIDQMDKLDNITLDVLMGITPAKVMVSEVTKDLGISSIDASLIVRDIDDEIFKPIKQKMIDLYQDGAPFKPKTMNTVDESDEDHSMLDKHEILREIENPPEPTKKVHAPDGSFAPSKTKVVEEYHTELSAPARVFTPPIATPITPKPTVPNNFSVAEESKKRLLDSIAEQKLSKVFTMPKQFGDLEKTSAEIAASSKPQAPVVPPQSLLSPNEVSFSSSMSKSEEKTAPLPPFLNKIDNKTSDPYRETPGI